jgi:hypothetical protein
MSLSSIFLSASPPPNPPPPIAKPAPKPSPLEKKRRHLIDLFKKKVFPGQIQETLGYSRASIRVFQWRFKTQGISSLLPKTTVEARTQKQIAKTHHQETIRNKAIALWKAKISSYKNIARLLQREYHRPIKENSVRVWISRYKRGQPLTTPPPKKTVIKV